jgi:dihydrofolate synthase/folylpolyglutamate synthase
VYDAPPSSRYEQALAVLHDALAFGIEPSLVGIQALTAQMGNPQERYRCIQVAGTNGKSSTTRFIAAFLRAHGQRVGLYTSPELVYYEERMELDSAVVTREQFAAAVSAAHKAAEAAIAQGTIALATEFELLTAAALWLFAEQQVGFAVLEAGLGGRWDATSVVTPEVAVITGIGLDHTAILGNTIEEIAAEKAAIIKRGGIPVLGMGTDVAPDVFKARCAEVGAIPLVVGEEALARAEAFMRGEAITVAGEAGRPGTGPLTQGTVPAARFPAYQTQNIATALVAAEATLGHPLDPQAVTQALATLTIPGRFELLREYPPLLIDAAHNPQSARVLAEALSGQNGDGSILSSIAEGCGLVGRDKIEPSPFFLRPLDPPTAAPTLLLGILADKDAEGIIDALVPLFDPQHIVVTQSASPRAIPADELARLIASATGCTPRSFPSAGEALEALTAEGAAVVATGSITLAGEVKRMVGTAPPPPPS